MSIGFNEYDTKKIMAIKRIVEIVSKIAISTPDHLRKYFVIAGGAFVDWYHLTTPKDIDIFILDNPYKTEIEMYINTLMNGLNAIKIDRSDEYRINNPKVVHVIDVKLDASDSKYQFIFTTHKTREELIKDFDYAHCMTNYHEGKLYISPKTFACIRDKKLVINNPKNIVDWRRDKFIKHRGFTVAA